MSKLKAVVSDVRDAAYHELDLCVPAERKGREHFLNYFRMAADDVAKRIPGCKSFDELRNPRDQKLVFEKVKEFAEPRVVKKGGFSATTFEKYCKVSRYCIIYHVGWQIADDANRDELRRCQTLAKDILTGNQEEKMEKAWEMVVAEKDEEKAKKKEKYNQWLELQNGKDSEPGDLAKMPNPGDFKGDHDAFWTAYLKAQVEYIQKHYDCLQGDSAVQRHVQHFLGASLSFVKVRTVA